MKNLHRAHSAFPWIAGLSLVFMIGLGCRPKDETGPAAKDAPAETSLRSEPAIVEAPPDLRAMWPSLSKGPTLRSSDATRASRWLVGYNVCRAVETGAESPCEGFEDMTPARGSMGEQSVTRMCRHWLGWLNLARSAASGTVGRDACEAFWPFWHSESPPDDNDPEPITKESFCGSFGTLFAKGGSDAVCRSVSKMNTKEFAKCRVGMLPLDLPVKECTDKGADVMLLCQDRARVAAAIRARDPGLCPAELQGACHALLAQGAGGTSPCGPVKERLVKTLEAGRRRALPAGTAQEGLPPAGQARRTLSH